MEAVVVTPPVHLSPPLPPPTPTDDLLRELIEVQREQLRVLRAHAASGDERAKWRGMHARHADDFPDLPAECRAVLPLVERAYLTAVSDLTGQLADPEANWDEFSVAEVLDRHVPRLGQLWSVLTQVGQLAAPSDPR
ncbi:MAG: hypothetical protein MUF18_03940 [Fimbriiglobus sp.]|nr:hypothetical protein [Fimbriiglobus sp.]